MPYTIPSSVISPGAVYQPRQIPAVISQNARALYYTRSGSTSSSLLLDQSPLNSGTRRTGEEGRCYLYDGVNDYSDTNSFSITNNIITFSCWFNTSNAATTQRIISRGVVTAGNDFAIQIFSSSLRIIAGNEGSSQVISTSVAINSNTDYHLCVVYDDGSLAVFLDGVLQFTEPSAVALSSDSLIMRIGRRTDNSEHFKGSIFDIRRYNKALTQDEVNFVYSFGETGTDPSLPVNWWKCDEQSGTVGYDSVGGNHLTHTNITAGTFHSTQNIWSFQNQVGFNKSGAVYIPRDESDPTNDVLGNPLTNTGRRPNDAALHSSNCLTADGTLYIAAAHLAGTETVVSSGGTSTPSISAGRIDFTAGTCWDLTLSDGTHYPLSEGWGVDIGSSTSDNDGVLTNSILANAWGATQNEYHYNLINGFSLYEHASTAAIRWPFKNGSVKTLTPPTGYSKTSDNYPGDYHNNAETLTDFDPDLTPEMGATQLGITVPASHAFGDAFTASDQIFSRQRTLTEDRFVVMPEAQTGSALATIQRYTQP